MPRWGTSTRRGNPHYWLDPRNGGLIARQIALALGRVDPEHAEDFARRAEEFAAASDAVAAQGAARVAALPEHTIVTYHASWVYLASALGLEIVGTVEPKPGIPPTGRHLDEIRQLIAERKVAVLLQEPYFSAEAGEYLARETGVRVAEDLPLMRQPRCGKLLRSFRSHPRSRGGRRGRSCRDDRSAGIALLSHRPGRSARARRHPCLSRLPCRSPRRDLPPGKLYLDSFRVTLPEEMPPGEYYLEVGWFDPRTGEQLDPIAEAIQPPLSILWRSVLLPNIEVRP